MWTTYESFLVFLIHSKVSTLTLRKKLCKITPICMIYYAFILCVHQVYMEGSKLRVVGPLFQESTPSSTERPCIMTLTLLEAMTLQALGGFEAAKKWLSWHSFCERNEQCKLHLLSYIFGTVLLHSDNYNTSAASLHLMSLTI